jgi:hypothetical protein
MNLFQIISGLILLTLGRKVFWLFISLMGFIVGSELADLLFVNQPAWLTLLMAILAGVLGAIIAVFAQRVGFILAGFLSGGYLFLIAGQLFVPYSTPELFFIIGGISGAVLTALFMDWAIIVLSCFAGAMMVLDVVVPGRMPGIIIFAVLVSAGILIQGRHLKGAGKGGGDRKVGSNI